jgi:3-methylfumaryl-CoA hydratase
MSDSAADWIGRRFLREERITPRALAGFRATFAGTLGPGAVPPGLHWTLVPDLADPSDLGRDGHPRTGLFLPALPLPRRMWAGGEMEFLSDFTPDDHVMRESTVADVSVKSGSTGQLGFVTLHHDWLAGGTPRLRERQDIVYREPPKPGTPAPPPQAEPWQADAVWTVLPDPVLLLRYSALTFNAHRIHYDLPYATGVEGYAGLVVHGPLQAIWMLNLAATMLGRNPARFRYRGLSPLICGGSVRVEARADGETIALRVLTEDGVSTMQATATV